MNESMSGVDAGSYVPANLTPKYLEVKSLMQIFCSSHS